jgi:HD-GYP domain-containing protein (c-di-GMP phosphodiesterase class II)
MYVAQLDRPWLETPFVFQGFEIKEQSEIHALKSRCDFVYIDIERGQLTEAEVRSLLGAGSEKTFSAGPVKKQQATSSGLLAGVRSLLGRNDSRAGNGMNDDSMLYEPTATVRREAPQAKAAYEYALSRYKAIVERARAVGEVSYEKAARAVSPTIESILRNPDAMAWTVFSRKRSGRDYSRAVATSVWSIMFGRHLGFGSADLKDLAIGGLLLDIGNVGVPDEIVNAEGAITLKQYAEQSRHVEIGLEILTRSDGYSDNVLDMIRCHHERSDGSGYPRRKAGNHIPAYGRIAGVADCYDAMTTKTSYSPALSAYDSARDLNDMRGKEFPAEVVGQFLKMIGMFPTGSVVEFSDGVVGVVLEQNRKNALRPKVMLLIDGNGVAFDEPRILDMKKLPEGDSALHAVSITKGHEHGAFGIDPLNYFA